MKPSMPERVGRLERKFSAWEKRMAKLHAWYSLFRTITDDPRLSDAEKLKKYAVLLAQLDREFPE